MPSFTCLGTYSKQTQWPKSTGGKLCTSDLRYSTPIYAKLSLCPFVLVATYVRPKKLIQLSNVIGGKHCTRQYLSVDNGDHCHHVFLNLGIFLASLKLI